MPEKTETERQLAVRKEVAARRAMVEWGEQGIEIHNLDQALTFGQMLIENGTAPKGFTSPGAIVVSVQKGAEMRCAAFPHGVPPMTALQQIPVINGRPFIMGDMAKAIVLADDDCEDFDEGFDGEKGTDSWVAWVETKRRSEKRVRRTEFTWADAKKAGLTTKGTWKDYPQRMLRYRALGFHLRDHWPDLMFGCRTFEEGRDMPPEPREINPKTTRDPLFAPEAPEPIDVEPEQMQAEPGTEDVPPVAPSASAAPAAEVAERDPASESEQPALDLGSASKPCLEMTGCLLGEGHSGACSDVL